MFIRRPVMQQNFQNQNAREIFNNLDLKNNQVIKMRGNMPVIDQNTVFKKEESFSVENKLEILDNLSKIIQNERNGKIYYSALSQKATSPKTKNYLENISNECEEIYKKLQELYFKINNENFEVSESKIETNILLKAGIKLALIEERNSIIDILNVYKFLDNELKNEIFEVLIQKNARLGVLISFYY